MNARRSSFRPGPFVAAKLAVLLAISPFPLLAQISSRPVPTPVQYGPQKLSQEQLVVLLAPVALYPDALIALILPASTVPSDVVLAARYLKSNGDPEHTENQPWDESVKSLTRYPEVLAWMDQKLEWTASLGEAFVEQPADVMSAVQTLRQQAKAAGNLADTPQQKVVEEESSIRIVPADPDVIYVPQYDPQVVYIQSYTSVPFVTFGLGCAVGMWLSYDFDWNRRCFYRGNWRGWNHGHGGNRGGASLVNIDINNANPWQPSANARRQTIQRQINNNGNARHQASGSGVVRTGTQAVAGSAINRAVRAENTIPAPGSVPQPPNPQRSSGSAGQNPGRVGTPASVPHSNPGAPTVVPGATPNTARANVPAANQPRTITPQIQQRQPPNETPDSRNHTPHVQQTSQRVPQQVAPQRTVPVVNPQIQQRQPPNETPDSRNHTPHFQQTSQRVPQQVAPQRTVPVVNPQIQPTPAPNTPNSQQPSSDSPRRFGGR